MKKTLFILAVALGLGQAYGDYVLPESGSITLTGNQHLHYAAAGGVLTYGGDINVGTYSAWIGPGANASGATSAEAAAVVKLTGVMSGTGTLNFNEYTNSGGNRQGTKNVAYVLSNADSTFSGTLNLGHGWNETNYVQLSLTSCGEAYKNSSVTYEGSKNGILSIEGNVSIGGLVGTGTAADGGQRVTSTSASNTLTINVANGLNKSFSGKVGAVSGNTYMSSTEVTSTAAPELNSTTLNIVKTGAGTQTFKGELALASVAVNEGTLAFENAKLVVANGTVTYAAAGGDMTLSGTTVLDAGGKTLKLTPSNGHKLGMQGNVYGNGTLYLSNVRVDGDLTLGGNANGNATGNGTFITYLQSSVTRNSAVAEADLTVKGGLTVYMQTSMSGVFDTLTVSNGSKISVVSAQQFNSTVLNNSDTYLVTNQSANLGALSGTGGAGVAADSATSSKIYIGSNAVEESTFNGYINTSGLANLYKEGSSTQNVVLTANSSISRITVNGGEMNFMLANTQTVTHTLTFGTSVTLNGGTLGIYTGTTVDEEEVGTLTTSNLTVSTDSALNANLVMGNNATLNLAGTVTMGCTVELGQNMTLNLTTAVNPETGLMLLFDSVDGATLGSHTGEYNVWFDASDVFSTITINGNAVTASDYLVGTWNDQVFLTNVNSAHAPEPATATLSLLALAGLCARRRRK